jgi:predicted nucleotide-binding protein
MRVLIVEDDCFFAQFVAEFLQDHSVETTIVRNAQEAVAVDIRNYDGAVIDIMLPNDPDASGITAEESRGGFSTGVAIARRLLQKHPEIQLLFLSSGVINGDAEKWAKEHSIVFVHKNDSSDGLKRGLSQLGLLGPKQPPLAFIVHGHDSSVVLELKNYIQNTLKWQEPIVLREQPNGGKTLIEKFEGFTRRVDCVFVLLTPDDKVIGSGSNEEKRRSRQNVIFELGVFYGAIGRESGRILLLYRGPVDLPSDISGIVWINIDHGIDAAGEEIRREVATFV